MRAFNAHGFGRYFAFCRTGYFPDNPGLAFRIVLLPLSDRLSDHSFNRILLIADPLEEKALLNHSRESDQSTSAFRWPFCVIIQDRAYRIKGTIFYGLLSWFGPW